MRKLGSRVRIPADNIEGVIDRTSTRTGRTLYRLNTGDGSGGHWYDAEEVRSA